jgi:hypothetical protein
MSEILATSSIGVLQSISLTLLVFYAIAVFLGTYIASRLYGFLGVCFYIMGVAIISMVLNVLFG